MLGIEYVAGFLKSKGHKVDLIFDPGLAETPYGRLPFLATPRLTEKMLNKARHFGPDIVMFSATTYSYPNVRQMALLIKNALAVPTLVGGVHPTMAPEDVIRDEAFDMLCIGEGELAAAELLDRMQRGLNYTQVRNIWVKEKGIIHRNEVRELVDINTLPPPDKEIFAQYGCISGTLYVMANRGCPFDCTYCFNSFYKKLYEGKGNYVRFRNPELVIAEIKDFIRQYPIRRVVFEDDTFTLNRNWLNRFLLLYGEQIAIPYRCLVRANTITPEIARRLKKSGCVWAHMGLESGDDSVANQLLGRKMLTKEVVEAAQLLKSEGIRIKLFAIFGFPDETADQMFTTVAAVEQIRPNAVCSYIFVPYPGTKLFDYSLQKNYIVGNPFETSAYNPPSIHEESILNHPQHELAYNIKVLLPFYNKSPALFRPAIRRLMTERRFNRFVADFLYMASVPCYSGGELWPKVRESASILVKTQVHYAK